MKGVRLEHAVAENKNKSSVELLSDTRSTYKQLQVVMRSVCRLYEGSFQIILEEVEQLRKDVGKSVHAMVCPHFIVLVGLQSPQTRSLISYVCRI